MLLLSLLLCCVCLLPVNDVVKVTVEGKRVDAVVSPDNKRIVFERHDGNDKEICVADRDGTNVRTVTRNRYLDYSPDWSADGKRIVFCSTRTGSYQVFAMARDGKNVEQLTTSPHGARHPRFSASGWLAYQRMHPKKGKSHPADLVIQKGNQTRTILTAVDIFDCAWSRDGKSLCVGTVNTLNFYDVESKKLSQVDVNQKDKRLYAHGPREITWSPDNSMIACRIRFLGGRTVGTVIYGDSELFVVSVSGEYEAINGERVKDRSEDWIRIRFADSDK